MKPEDIDRSKRTCVKMPAEHKKRIDIFNDALEVAFEIQPQKLEHAIREFSDLLPQEVMDRCLPGRSHWTCFKRKMDPTRQEHWEFCCSSFTTLEDSTTHYLYVLVGLNEAETLFKKHDL